jgi:peptidoglycan/LPS O-acetylase OafA/YrhL
MKQSSTDVARVVVLSVMAVLFVIFHAIGHGDWAFVVVVPAMLMSFAFLNEYANSDQLQGIKRRRLVVWGRRVVQVFLGVAIVICLLRLR